MTMDVLEKRMAQIRALGRVVDRKYGLPLPGDLMVEYRALENLKGYAHG